MRRFEVRHLDDKPQSDEVAFALVPIDSFTGAIVKKPLKAKIDGSDHHARRNLSGMLVFVNLRELGSDKDLAGTTFKVEIKAEPAGYFDQTKEVVHPPKDAADQQLLNVVTLYPTPQAAFTNETTLIRGVVLQDGTPVEQAKIGAIGGEVEPQPDAPLQFETRSDVRGAFVLPLRLPKQTPGQVGVPSATFWFRFGTAAEPAEPPARQLRRRVTDGRPHRFGMPIDLAGDETTISPTLVPIQF